MTTIPAPTPPLAAPGVRLQPWSDRMRRAMLPAIIAACYSGDEDRACDLCVADEPDPGLTGPAMTDPTDRRH